MHKPYKLFILSVLAICAIAGTKNRVFAQAITGTVVGTISDKAGAVVPGATVTITNMGTGIPRAIQSGSNGEYTFTNLTPGQYSVAVTSHGFKTAISDGSTVNVEETTRVDLVLVPGTESQRVTVMGQTPLVGSTTSDLGTVIGSKQIEALPLNGRLFEQLVTLSPGVIPNRGFGDTAENPSAAGSVTPTQVVVNGLPLSGNNYMVDGIHDLEPLNGFITITPPLDAIQEFKVETSDPTAEYGLYGGAIINLTIKSGTNQFHGGIFDYLRNDALNAKDYFATTKPEYKSNQFGGSFGGPIIKNKLFFFLDYQQLAQHVGEPYLFSVPTVKQRQGILNEGNQDPIYNPATGQEFGTCPGSSVPGFCIPQDQINPVALAVANLYPLPNVAGLDGGTVNNYATNTVNSQNVPQFDLKGDWQATQKDRIFARNSLALRKLTSPSPGNIYMMGGPPARDQADNAVLGWDHVFSSTQLNSARIGFNRTQSREGTNNHFDTNNMVGIPNGNIPSIPYTVGLAQFNIPGYYSTGDPGSDVLAERIANIFEYSDTYSWILKQHDLKFGVDIQRIQNTLTNPQDDPRGIFNFNGNITSNNGAAGTGNPIASFLLGYPASVLRDFVNVRPGIRETWSGVFVQDNYRVTQKLTLNLGLRWDVETAPVEVKNNASNFNTTTGLIDIADGNDRSAGVDTYYGQFAPRVGIAYSPDNGKTALRAAYGASYFQDIMGPTGTIVRNFPFFTITSLSNPTPYKPFWNIAINGLPPYVPISYTHGGSIAPPPGFGVFWIPKNDRPDMAQVWNISVQRQLPYNIALSVAYVGTRGTHLFRDVQINQTTPGDLNIADLPFHNIAPNITTVDRRYSDGSSIYNAGQLSLQKRASNGLTFSIAYTWSKSIDDTTSVISPFVNSLNRQVSSGFSQVDIPHVLTVSYVYDLPVGHGKQWMNGSSWTDRLVSNWQVNGIVTYIPLGAPVALRVASPRLNNIQGGFNYPDRTCSHIDMPKSKNEWFDTSCFAAPPPSTFGNNGVGDVRAPGNTNFDFSIAKAASLGGSRQLKLEGDFFNLFNTAHWAAPGAMLGAGTFGVISSDALPPRYVQIGANLQF